MTTEVEELIQEQSMTNLNLEILSENETTFKVMLSEFELSNEYNELTLEAIKDLGTSLNDIFNVDKTSKFFLFIILS